MTRWLAWVAIAGLAAYLTFIGGAWLGIYAAPLRLTTMLMASGILAIWLLAGVRSEHWRPRSALMPAILAALASLAISTLFSRVPRVSLEYLGYAVVLAALYLLLVRLMAHPFFVRRLLSLSGLFFVVIVSAYLLLVVWHWIEWWRVLGRVAIPPLRPNFEGLTYLNPSAVLTMAVLLGLPVAGLAKSGSRRGSVAVGLIALSIGLVALLTGSRAGWLAIALALVLGLGAILLHAQGRAGIAAVGRRLLARRAAVGVAAVAVATVLLLAAAFAPAILRRVTEGGESARAQYAITALRMFGESPIVGTGPGTWVIQRVAATTSGEIDYYIPHAHNIEVQTLAELGLIGALAGVVLVVSLGVLLRSATRDADPWRRRMGWASLLGLSYLAFHQLLDFYANMPAVLLAAAVPIAYLDATAGPSSSPPGRWSARSRQIGRIVTIGVVGVALIGLTVQEIGRAHV